MFFFRGIGYCPGLVLRFSIPFSFFCFTRGIYREEMIVKNFYQILLSSDPRALAVEGPVDQSAHTTLLHVCAITCPQLFAHHLFAALEDASAPFSKGTQLLP